MSNHFLFQVTRNNNQNKFVRTKILKPGQDINSILFDPLEGLRKIKEGHFAFYCEEAVALVIIPKLFDPHEICGTNQILFDRSSPAGVFIKRFSPLRERFLINFLRISEIGIRRKMLDHWNGVKPNCTSKGHFESLRIEYIAPALLFLAAAHLISLLILICDQLVVLKTKKQQNALNC